MKKFIIAIGICLLFSNEMFAQFYVGTDLSFMTLQHSTYMSNVNLINSNTQYFQEEYAREKKRIHKGNSSSSNAPSASSFLFETNKETSQSVRQTIIDNVKKKFPNSIIGEALNDKNNPYPNYVKLLKTLGLDVQHDYADAFTAYILGMWRIANKMSANPTKEQIQNVRKQVLEVTDVSKLNNTQKQEAAEYIMYELIFANEPYEGSRLDKDQKQLQIDSDAVYNRFLKQNKMDLRNMTITSNGLVRKK